MTAAVYLTIVLAAIDRSARVALLVGATFGTVRGLAILLGARLRLPEAIRRSTDRFEALAGRSLAVAVAGADRRPGGRGGSLRRAVVVAVAAWGTPCTAFGGPATTRSATLRRNASAAHVVDKDAAVESDETLDQGRSVVRTRDESGLCTRDDRVGAGAFAGTALLGMVADERGLTIAAASGAAAAGCAAKVTISGPSHGNLVLSPNAVKVQTGQCVEFVNSTSSRVSLSVSRSGKTSTRPGSRRAVPATSPPPAAADNVSASSRAVPAVHRWRSVTATAPPSPVIRRRAAHRSRIRAVHRASTRRRRRTSEGRVEPQGSKHQSGKNARQAEELEAPAADAARHRHQAAAVAAAADGRGHRAAEGQQPRGRPGRSARPAGEHRHPTSTSRSPP